MCACAWLYKCVKMRCDYVCVSEKNISSNDCVWDINFLCVYISENDCIYFYVIGWVYMYKYVMCHQAQRCVTKLCYFCEVFLYIVIWTYVLSTCWYKCIKNVVGKEIFLLVWEVYNKHFGTFCVFGIFVEGITREALSIKVKKLKSLS